MVSPFDIGGRMADFVVSPSDIGRRGVESNDDKTMFNDKGQFL